MDSTGGARLSGKRGASVGPSLVQTESSDVNQPRRSRERAKTCAATSARRGRGAPVEADALRDSAVTGVQEEAPEQEEAAGVPAPAAQFAEMQRKPLGKPQRKTSRMVVVIAHLRAQVAAHDLRIAR